MSRALGLLWHGDLWASLLMHPLALPSLLVQAALAASTVIVTLERGTPFDLLKTRYGRASVYAVVAVFSLVLLLWIARWFGFAGGPVLV